MKEYLLESVDRKTVILHENSIEIARLNQSGWIGLNATILIRGKELFQLKRKKMFSTTALCSKDGNQIGELTLRFGWKVKITIGQSEVYILEKKTFFGSEYIVKDHAESILYEIRPRFQLSGLTFRYEFSSSQEQIKDVPLLVLMLSIYSVSFLLKNGSSQG